MLITKITNYIKNMKLKKSNFIIIRSDNSTFYNINLNCFFLIFIIFRTCNKIVMFL